MRLQFVQRHLSIAAFPDIDLPPLTIILGPNGSGKTHLLQAIASGNVANDVVPVPVNTPLNSGPGRSDPTDIRLLTSVGVTTSSELYNPPVNTTPIDDTAIYAGNRSIVLAPFAAALDALSPGLSTQFIIPGEDLWRLGAAELARRAQPTANEQAIADIFQRATAALSANMPHVGRAAWRLKVSPLELTGAQVKHLAPYSADQFAASPSLMFGRYRDALLHNRLARLKDEDAGTSESVSEEEFVRRVGPPPWKQISETIQSFGLNYKARQPNLYEYSPVAFVLEKVPNGEEVNIQNLSSGERVLIQFALASFAYDENMVNLKRPKLLLLDELDAPLHPEMVHRWLGAISDGLVARQSIQCIMTTHSPTTVALAPEAALYEMRDGYAGLTKSSKQDALNKLTFGVPTLSIDYLGRRQVFTESDTDAEIYERIYALTKSLMSCERELNFLSTGMRNKDGGEINSGCVVVKNIVEQMADYGARNVFGIVDWDGATTSTDRVKVVAEGLRDGIENVLLDPVLVCLLLVKHRKAPEGLSDIDRFTGVETLDASELQRLADAIQFKAFPQSRGAMTGVHYLGGQSVNVLNEYLTINDHDLEELLAETFRPLRSWSRRGRGQLVKGIIEEVLTEHRGFCPAELRTVFECIANAPA